MTDVDRLLTETFEELGRQAPHDPDLVGVVRRRARRQAAVVGSALAVLLVAGVSTAALAGRPGGTPAAGGAVETTPPPATGCPAPETGVLPEWAQGGFSEPEAGGVPFVRGAKGDMVAILFGPLLSPPVPDRGNKILWVPRVYPAGPVPALVIEARLDGTTETARIELPAPGPSGVDLPEPGCWHLQLTWGGASDSLSLRYEPS